MLFCSVSLKQVDEKRHRRLAENAQRLGGFVRDLKLTLEDALLDNNNLSIYQILSSMPNVRTLVIVHQQDIARHTPLQRAIEKFVHLEEISIEEKAYDPGDVSIPMDTMTDIWFNTFLSNVLRVHGGRLRALHLYTPIPLDPQPYIDIRDKTPNLRSVTFTNSIGVHMGDVFAEATPWASGQTGNLKDITLVGCSGTHADRFVENILRGVYGVRLEEIRFITSGGYIIGTPEPPSTPVFKTIERLHFDHINRDELTAIALLPIQELSLTGITHDALRTLPTLLEEFSSNFGRAQQAFMGLRRLRLSQKFRLSSVWNGFPTECRTAYEALRDPCSRRQGIQLTLDAVDGPMRCACTDHE